MKGFVAELADDVRRPVPEQPFGATTERLHHAQHVGRDHAVTRVRQAAQVELVVTATVGRSELPAEHERDDRRAHRRNDGPQTVRRHVHRRQKLRRHHRRTPHQPSEGGAASHEDADGSEISVR
jgi:hypothetical protein